MELLAAFRVIGLQPELNLYMFYVSWKISLTFFKLLSNHKFQTENYIGAYFRKNIGRVMVFDLCTATDHALYLHKVL